MISLQAKLAAGLAGLAFLIGSHWYAYESGADNREAHLQHQRLKAYTENLQAAADKTYQLQLQKDEAINEYISRQSVLNADARSARSESERLRGQLAAIQRSLPDLAEQAVRSYADTVSIVFGACAQRYTELAADADRLGNAAQTLNEAWPK